MKGLEDKPKGMEILMVEVFVKINPTRRVSDEGFHDYFCDISQI